MASKAKAKTKAPTESATGRFELDGEILEFNLDELSFGEGEELETYFDQPVHEIDFESARGVLWIAYLALKRKHPDTTLDDVREMRLEALQKVDSVRPTEQASEQNGTPPSPTS